VLPLCLATGAVNQTVQGKETRTHELLAGDDSAISNYVHEVSNSQALAGKCNASIACVIMSPESSRAKLKLGSPCDVLL
jgi:hypothetical protein